MRGVVCCWIVGVGLAWAGVAAAAPKAGAAPAAPKVSAQAQYKAAVAEREGGNYQKALDLIEQGLGVAPRDADLLGLKGAILLELRDYPGALAGYQAYLQVIGNSENRRQAQKIVDKLLAVQSTFLDITVANGPAEIYLDSKTLGVFCTAAPACHQPVLPGEYKVIAERPGFRRWTGAVTAVKDAPTPLSITLIEQPSQLTVSVTPAGAQITVDGEAYEAPREVPAGPHRVVVSLAGHGREQRDVVAREGKPLSLELALAPLVPIQLERPAAPGRFTGRRKLALVAGGVGLGALGAGVVLGLQAKRLDDDAYALCTSPSVACVDAAAANDLNQRARSRAVVANVAYGVAGAAAVAAAILWLTGAPELRVAVTPRVGSIAGLDLAVRF
jgi:hypothetical protein